MSDFTPETRNSAIWSGDSRKVANDAKIINEFGYPYSYGYLEAAVSNAIFELKALMTQQ